MQPLEPDMIYHIYNRANGNEKLFVSDDNYRFFLQKYRQYISRVADTFSYCLMPNHFHFLIRIKDGEHLRDHQGFQNLDGLGVSKLLSQQFSNFFNSYTKAFNKQQNRMGSLFMSNFKRKPVTDQTYLYKLIHYIHYSPVAAGICEHPEQWPHSSYFHIVSNNSDLVLSDEVVAWFEDLGNFIYCHHNEPQLTGVDF